MAGRRKYLIVVIILFLMAEGLLALGYRFVNSSVLIYMYHSVSEEPISIDSGYDEPELSVKPSEFEKQLEFFSKRGLKTVFADELPELDTSRGRYLVLTFDDGYEDNYTEAFPLLKKYNCKATIFMITSLIDAPGYLTSDQIREMTQSGLVSVQSHTVTHQPLAWWYRDYDDVVYELGDSKRVLESISGRPVTALSVPNGSYDSAVMDIAEKYYDVMITGTNLRTYSDKDLMDLQRIGIYRRHKLSDIRRMTDNRGVYFIKRIFQKLAQD